MFRFLSFRSIILKQGRDDLLRFETYGDDLAEKAQDVTFVIHPIRIAFDSAAPIDRDAILVDDPIERRAIAQFVSEDFWRDALQFERLVIFQSQLIGP